MILILMTLVVIVSLTACSEDESSNEQPGVSAIVEVQFYTVRDTIWYQPTVVANTDTVTLSAVPVAEVHWNPHGEEVTASCSSLWDPIRTDETYELGPVSEWGNWRYAGNVSDVAIVKGTPRFFCDREIKFSFYYKGHHFQDKDRIVFIFGGGVEELPRGGISYDFYVEATREGGYASFAYTDFQMMVLW